MLIHHIQVAVRQRHRPVPSAAWNSEPCRQSSPNPQKTIEVPFVVRQRSRRHRRAVAGAKPLLDTPIHQQRIQITAHLGRRTSQEAWLRLRASFRASGTDTGPHTNTRCRIFPAFSSARSALSNVDVHDATRSTTSSSRSAGTARDKMGSWVCAMTRHRDHRQRNRNRSLEPTHGVVSGARGNSHVYAQG